MGCNESENVNLSDRSFFFFFFFFHEHLFIYFSSLRYSIYITILTLLTIRVTYTENTITQLNVIQAI